MMKSERQTEKMATALQQAGLRVTAQRLALLKVIDETEWTCHGLVPLL